MSKEEKGISKGMHSEKALVVFILVLGIILGGLLSAYLVFPEMNKTILKENSDLKEKNRVLEQEANSIISCMQKKNVNYYQDCK